LYSIAFRYGMDFRKVAAANGITAPYTIYPGQQIRLDETPRAQASNALPAATTYPPAPTPIVAPRPVLSPATSPTPPRPVLSPVPSQAPSPVLPDAPPPSPAPAADTPLPGTPPAGAVARTLPAPGGPPVPVISGPAAEPQGQPVASVPDSALTPTVDAARPASEVTPAAAPQASPSGGEAFAGEVITAWRWPTAGPVIRGYSESVHKGIDIGGGRGDPVTAVAAGKVVYAGTGIAGFGELLIIKHNDVYLSAYGHNDELLVTEGDVVVAGQTIAQKGSSGTDAVKLHFEIRKEGKPIDPLRVLPGR